METPVCNSIIEHLTDGVVVIDSERRLVDINPAARKIINLTDTRIVGNPVTEVLAESPVMLNAVQHPEQADQDITVTHEYGTYHVKVTLQSLTGSQGDIGGYAIILHDTSEQKSTEYELRDLADIRTAELSNTSEQLLQAIGKQEELEEQLRQSRKMETVGRLASGVAHDFGNLLTTILGCAELGLRETNPDSKTNQYFRDIKSSALIASDLTDQLLSFGHRRKAERKYIDLNHVINHLLSMVSRIIGEDIILDVQLSADLYPIYVDPDQIQQLITSLCASARDTMPDGGKLTIRTDNLMDTKAVDYITEIDSESSYMVLTLESCSSVIKHDDFGLISNSGNGIAPTNRDGRLGLAIAEAIIKQYQGHLKVERQIGEGGSVAIYLPATPNMELTMESKTINDGTNGGSETILLVEDNDMVLNIAIRLLSDLGYNVLFAHNADEAMGLFQENLSDIDLVMSDVVMPRSSGPEMYSRMYSMQPELPALFVTGYDVNQSIETLEMLECQQNCSVLQKPYTQHALAKKLRELLARELA